VGPLAAMSLRKEFVKLLATKISEELVEKEMIEVPQGFDLAERIHLVMEAEANVEDKLNEEVRTLLTQYQDHMRENGISYQEMFKLIKNKLVKERKVTL
jgi:hypothetical protein